MYIATKIREYKGGTKFYDLDLAGNSDFRIFLFILFSLSLQAGLIMPMEFKMMNLFCFLQLSLSYDPFLFHSNYFKN